MAKSISLKKKAYNRKWNADHPEKCTESTAKWRKKNLDKHRATYTNWAAKNPEKVLARNKANRLKKYGLTVEQYEAMLKDQQNCCALCHNPFGMSFMQKPCIDHCHETNLVRGILHNGCNTAIGTLGDTVDGVTLAVEYLQNSS